ncbi:MAG TPA: LPS assembly protein LptD, partial [Acidobacteriaceae bacterium]
MIAQVSNLTPPPAATNLPDEPLPDLPQVPRATPLPPEKPPAKISWDADTQSKHGSVYLLAGNVDVTSGDHELRADTISYNEDTHVATATGHVRLTGGDNDEYLEASRAEYNLKTGTGRFYDVHGSVSSHGEAGAPGGRSSSGGVKATTPEPSGKTGLVTPNPFLFSGRLVIKTSPRDYDIYDGSVTSCALPRPDWLLSAGHLSMNENSAHASNSVFRLLGVPLLFLPYVTHPINTEQRQSGILVPEIGQSSTKGWIIGEQYYQTLGRSADLTAGLLYYSLRGYSEMATFRARGRGDNFFQAHFSALQDRGYTPTGGTYTNQGGEDVTAAFRKQLHPNTRFVGDGEYLSSYVYREAFTENFNQAVSSDITSIGYLTRETDGFALDARADRYQGLKRVPTNTTPGEEIRILHVPSGDVTAIDRHLGNTPLLWSLTGSVAGLKRAEPDFTSSGIVERLDLRPELSLPLSGDGWHLLASVAVRETFYSRSREAPYTAGASPVELPDAINRQNVDLQISIRPPAIERTFEVPPALQNLFGTEVRHTLDPEITYRNVHGIDNFLSVLRFDDIDLASNVDELEYGATQHLYFRPKPKHPKTKPGCNAVATNPGAPESAASSLAGVTGLPSETWDQQLPDVLNPTPASSTDANGIPDASAQAPQAPTRTRATSNDCAPEAPAQQ